MATMSVRGLDKRVLDRQKSGPNKRKPVSTAWGIPFVQDFDERVKLVPVACTTADLARWSMPPCVARTSVQWPAYRREQSEG